jgi:hypothetical protein
MRNLRYTVKRHGTRADGGDREGPRSGRRRPAEGELTVRVDAAYVRKQLADIVKDQDLSRYIL